MKTVIMSVRFPQQVAKELRKRAKLQNRSINSQIVHEIGGFAQNVTKIDYKPSNFQTYSDTVNG